MDISAKVTKLEGREPLMGLATVNFGNVVKIGSISIRKNREGNLYIKMPSYKTNQVDENGKDVYKDVAFPVSKEAAAQIKQAVLDEYFGRSAEKQGRDYDFAELEKDAVNPFDLGEEAEVSSPAKEKKEHTSIKDRLKDGEAKKNAKLAEKADKAKPPKAKEALAV